ncbi:4Fe-4S dicluster domain-containing protein [Propionicimonas sp.]|uniref:4Fe-4S dicluster domain-containing protein n=1 Tax=Propionicimonas sp. TaxID=1955623 RepID=UPI0017C410E7|nr:4Fe-4S dicluster domain-containing protein [Propionicimonas sp.]MBU3976234.1 4Fe-4S dicluster domain-containing protein [Actinomycetota bacterium]MBA3021046.1 4Fe-4S dicluster domain-containing protein [Propionicimonas sp.]MBU3985629.1 4Fe-4S dicluster domain-containing protein [Actinomycetota bacterium]MBU4008414.1 4Fe-4S dicluster domain-containing protein [Actinomycetota bacterium]MBU4066436.1 4Fe-4S dicluster domain-containing protein [Actinomycetota bacterium]
MATLVNPNLITDLQKFGAADVNACFSCGNCTAICPLADNDATFPRRFIRLAQVGLTDDLVTSKELWTCYQCGMCTSRCPQEADPAEFMATARRYAIAKLDRTGIARAMYTSPVAAAVISLVGLVIFGGFFASVKASAEERLVFGVPYEWIHLVGLVVMILVVLIAVFNLAMMARATAKRDEVSAKSLFGSRKAWGNTLRAVWYSVGVESLGQKRYREDCEDDDPKEPLYRRRWLIHFLTVWGFLALFAATLIHYGSDIIGLQGAAVGVVALVARLVGTVGGVAMMYGVTWFMINRKQKVSAAAQHSAPSDWLFLWMLWITGLTGFIIEVSLYLPQDHPQPWAYVLFLVHVAIAMELVLFLPFTKFAHVMYRPVALFFYALAKQRSAELQSV